MKPYPLPAAAVRLCAIAFLVGSLFRATAAEEPLRVCVSTPDLASLVAEVGGARVNVLSFSSGPEDPHQIQIRPGLVRELDKADLFVQVGLGIENAWLESLMARVKNTAVKPGQKGHLNIGRGVRLLDGMEKDGKPGTFHEEGNPHYLLDPLEGLKAARAIRDRLIELRPAWKDDFTKRHADFRLRLATELIGAECAKDDDLEEVIVEIENAKTAAEVASLQAKHKFAGWLGSFSKHRGAKIVGDHDLWPYFARRYGLEVIGYLEPEPGVPPTTKHLLGLIEKMKAQKAGVILTAPYFDQKHVVFTAKASGARIVPMAHQTGGRDGADTYIAMVRHNATVLLAALKGR